MLALIERWKNAELGLLPIERWQAERREFYAEIKDEMRRTGNDFFLPKSLKKLVAIQGPNDIAKGEKMEKEWVWCREKARLNELDQVLESLERIVELEEELRGPYGWTIWKMQDGSFDVFEPGEEHVR